MCSVTANRSSRSKATTLGAWFKPFGSPFGQLELAGGQGALLWLDVVVDSADAVPQELTHEVTFTFAQPNPPIVLEEMTETIAPIQVTDQRPIVIGPPLEGSGWLDGNSCCEITAHRTAVNPINGGLHAPERFAIDYVRIEDDGLFLHGPADELASYQYYGANILAVGDGPIVSMRWDLPEQPPGKDPTGLTLDEYGGNHIVQDLGGGHYAFYAHLQPGNAMGVEVGQVLKKGEVIALLGNTGNTDSPHLHFHIMDYAEPARLERPALRLRLVRVRRPHHEPGGDDREARHRRAIPDRHVRCRHEDRPGSARARHHGLPSAVAQT